MVQDIKGVGNVGSGHLHRRTDTLAAQTAGASNAQLRERAAASPSTTVQQATLDAPVDHDRVAEIRARIADGSYRVSPEQLASDMIDWAKGEVR